MVKACQGLNVFIDDEYASQEVNMSVGASARQVERTHSPWVISVSFLASPAATLRDCCDIGVAVSMDFLWSRAGGIRAVEKRVHPEWNK